jgi:hypothetical protein
MSTLLIHYRVQDYETWRKVFDGNEPARTAATMTDCRVYRDTDDGNHVLMTLKVADREKAQAFRDSPELRQVTQKAGVITDSIVRHFDPTG